MSHPKEDVVSSSPTTQHTDRGAGRVVDLGHPWPGVGPFLFGAHHLDAYPAGNGEMGPATGTAGHTIGSDFGHPSGWNMYHGENVPGFPAHPHPNRRPGRERADAPPRDPRVRMLSVAMGSASFGAWHQPARRRAEAGESMSQRARLPVVLR